MKCPKCNTQNPENAKFCEFCGSRLDSVAEEKTEASTGRGMEKSVPKTPEKESSTSGKKGKGWKIALVVLLAMALVAALLAAVRFVIPGDPDGPSEGDYTSSSEEEDTSSSEEEPAAASEGEFTAYYCEVTASEVEEYDSIHYAKGRLALTAQADATFSEVESLLESYGGEIIGYISTTNDYQVLFSGTDTYEEMTQLAESLLEEDLISEAMPEYVFEITADSVDYTLDPWQDADDPSDDSGSEWDESNPKGNNWWAEAIHMPSVWKSNLSTQTVRVGIIDSMFDITNEDLDRSGLFVELWNNPEDEDGNCTVTEIYESAQTAEEKGNSAHGTLMSGIIAAEAEDGFGITGINQDVLLYGYAYLSEEGQASDEATWGTFFQWKYALALLLNQNVRIINMSIGFDDLVVGCQNGDEISLEVLWYFSNSMEDFLLKYINIGQEFLICKCAGNCNGCDVQYDFLGAISNETVKNRIIIVGNAERCNLSKHGYYVISDDSNIGDRVDVYAPGENILSDKPGNVTALCGGTSPATAIVTGVASLIWGINPELTSEQVKEMIVDSTNTVTIRDGVSFSKYVTIIDAKYCVWKAQKTAGKAIDASIAVGTVMGMIYYLNEGSVEAINYDSIAVYAASGKLAETILFDPEEDYLGMYSIVLEPGTYTLEVKAEGFETVTVEVIVGETEVLQLDIEMEFSKEGMLQGKLDELIDTYGIFASGQSTVTNYNVSAWFDPTGILSAEILDLDADESPELLVCRTEEWINSGTTYYKIRLEVYEADAQTVTLADSMWYEPYGDSQEDDTSYVHSYTALKDTESVMLYVAMNAVQTESGYYLVCQYDNQGVFSDGGYSPIWVLEYQNGNLQYVCSLESEMGSSPEFKFAYEFEDGVNTKTTMYYAHEINEATDFGDLEGEYTDLGEGWISATEFFENYGLKFVSTIMPEPEDDTLSLYVSVFSGTTSGDSDTELEFCLSIYAAIVEEDLVTYVWTYAFEEELIRGNGLLLS